MMQTSEQPGFSEHLDPGRVPGFSEFLEEREELERVLRHPEISRSVSLVRFLGFICQKYFDDKSNEIREHSIAVQALGRKESTFDSQIDPIVRVTARALRKRLRDFYENEGKDHALEIVIPLGRYIPQFVRRPERNSEPLLTEPSIFINHELPQHQALGEVPTQPDLFRDSLIVENGPHDTRQKTKRRAVWTLAYVAVAFAIIFYAGLLYGRHTRISSKTRMESMKWGQPTWSDEFNGPAQSVPDSSKWTYDVGRQNSWGNHELETYCSPGPVVSKGCDPLHPNIFEDGAGHLVLRALRDAEGNWTSARITTRGLKNFQYGRIEARMKLPVGTGLWPAFWMLGANFDSVGWPAAGAVDIAENVALTSRSNGLGPTMIRASLHGLGYAGGNSLRRDYKLPDGGKVDDGSFHTYGIIWSPGMMQFYVDDPSNIFFVQNASNLPDQGEWSFDHPFYLVMDLAVGGDWSGDPDTTTPNSAEILVDYVRAYKLPSAAPTIEWHPVQVKSGSMISSTISLHGQRGAGRVYLSCSTIPATDACVLDASTVDFSDTDVQQDTVTISTDQFAHGTNVIAPPGPYKLILTATTISGDQSQLIEPFEVTSAR